MTYTRVSFCCPHGLLNVNLSRIFAVHLTAKDENNPLIFERQILRKIFGPVNIDNIWRIRNNTEIDKLIEDADRARFIKAQRIKWLGHTQRMDQTRPTRKL
jgi:hypothetical protein